MSKIPRVGSLEIDQDLDFEHRQWTVQRIGWAVILLILAAGIAGLLGSGPLSHAEAAQGPLTLSYERFVRKRGPSELQIHLAPGAAQNDVVAIWIAQDYLDKIDIERLLPEPVEVSTSAERVVYHFAIEDPAQRSEIIVDLEPSEPGRIQGHIGLLDGPEIVFDQFIYP